MIRPAAPRVGGLGFAPAPNHLVADGPVVVAIGGGHGLARSLGAIRRYASEITAVVSVADDGGSSGRLREALAIPAPGDIRKCLVALAPHPSLLADALEHRFDVGELEGHAFGNLLLAALDATTGDFVAATLEVCRLLGTLGTVLPAADAPVVLHAFSPGGELEGQVRIMASTGVTRVTLEPADVAAPDAVLRAIEVADQIVIGPGSLYTSVLAALAPNGIAETIANSNARRIYVCNLREQIPETAGYDVASHVNALIAHGVSPDVVICDTTVMALGAIPPGLEVVVGTLAARIPMVHDEELLGAVLEKSR